MLKNYFKIALRSLLKHRAYSVINISGLAIGMAASILILLYLQHELSYDRHFKDYERIFRIGSIFHVGEDVDEFALSSSSLGPMLAEEYEEFGTYTRLLQLNKTLITSKYEQDYETGFSFADSTLPDVFELTWLSGDPDSALRGPNQVVLTVSMARKYFPGTSAMGKQITMGNNKVQTVTGVIGDLPRNTHTRFEGLISYSSIARRYRPDPKNKGRKLWAISDFTFVKLPPDYDLQQFYSSFETRFFQKYMAPAGAKLNSYFEPVLEPLSSIHFDSALTYDKYPRGNRSYILAFSTIGLFILILACINYMNLATARSTTRAKEVGIRKVLGGSKIQLIQQFLGESMLTSLIAYFLALALVEVTLTLTPINEILERNLELDLLGNPLLSYGSLGLMVMIGLISGLYPAFYLSSILPIRALKGSFNSSQAGLSLRKLLVGFQFTISIGVIVCTLLMSQQIAYLRDRNLGFDKENLLMIPASDSTLRAGINDFRQELEQHPKVMAVANAYSAPGVKNTISRNIIRAEVEGELKEVVFNVMFVDYGYVEALGLDVLTGRTFNEAHPTDTNSVIINEAAVRMMGWDEPLGKRMQIGLNLDGTAALDGPVLGVVKDFNVSSLHSEVQPMMLILQRLEGGLLNVRLKGEELLETMADIETLWDTHFPDRPFDYFFLDENFLELYKADQRQAWLIALLALLCIFISCLGLLGLSSYNTSKRTKEIGMRKVLGASMLQIIMLLFKDILFVVFFSTLLAAPIAWLIINRWMQNFAYQDDIDWIVFVLAGLMGVAFAFLTVFFHTFRAAQRNPVRALKYE